MQPLLIIPWENDFLAALAGLLAREVEDGARLDDYLILFPHRRPARHLVQRLMALPGLPKPCLLPEMAAVDELVARLAEQLGASSDALPRRRVGLLDQAGLLKQVVGQVQAQGLGIAGRTHLPVDDDRRFFPWGVRLARLLEELFRQNIEPMDLTYMQGQVMDFAAAILEQLGAIGRGYQDALTERGWTTAGLDAMAVAGHANEAAALLAGRRVIIAGFYALSGVEEALLRAMCEAGNARMLLHTDSLLAAPRKGNCPHWACEEHAALIQRWGAPVHLLEPPATGPAPRVRFIEGFDLHSQLDAMGQELASRGELADTAVVVPDTGMLLPVLHHLPRKDVNISLGYPLGRSVLFRLVETLLRLQETATEPGRYYWKDVIDLARHPYLKMLWLNDEQPLRTVFNALEKYVRRGEKYLDPRHWAQLWREGGIDPGERLPMGADGRVDEQAAALLDEVLDLCLTRWEGVDTLGGVARNLEALYDLFLRHGGDLWQRFPIDAECLYRVKHSLAPTLGDNSLADTPYDAEVLFAILRQLVQAERVPFEADPLTGLQVLGVLETRLLRFENLLIVGATDDQLPGASAYDPLLPAPLRHLLGLPDERHRDQVAAYNFFRLYTAARDVAIFYKTGVEGGLMESKSLRSRFVEELLWHEEQRRGTLLKNNDEPVSCITYPIRSIPRRLRAIEKTDAVAARLDAWLDEPISATALDTYLGCPARFFHERLAGLREMEEINEEGDASELGKLVHDVLEEFFRPRLGKPLSAKNLDGDALADLFSARLAERRFHSHMAHDLRLLLEKAGRLRLKNYIAGFEPTTILGLEKGHVATLTAGGRDVTLTGRIDRVDERDGGRVILDYKTGSLYMPSKKLWKDEVLWEGVQEIANGAAPPDGGRLPLVDLHERVKSLQLPCYLHVYGRSFGVPVHDAGMVELAKDGEEKLLFGKTMNDDARREAGQTQVPTLLAAVLRHMMDCQAFAPSPGPLCRWCGYQGGCGGKAPAGYQS